MSYEKLLRDSAEVWCPNFPRKSSAKMNNDRGWGQITSRTYDGIIRNVRGIEEEAPGFVSVYSFPEGHTSESESNVPLIDTLMFDLDFEGSVDDSRAEWARDMSALLVRTRMIAKTLIEMGRAKYWRASLSGHKGIHLYLDFPALGQREGEASQYRNGMRNYTNNVVEALKDETGLSNLDDYIDVSSGKDLARMTRLPNSVHEKATERFGERRYCVPVSIEELAEIEPADYIQLTNHPRPLPAGSKRVENQRVHDILTQEIRMAKTSGDGYSAGSYDPARIEAYEEQASQAVTLNRAKIFLKQKPCIWAFRESGEMFDHGAESHTMELNCIAALMDLNAPVDTIVEFFDTNDKFSEEYTREKVKELIAYGYDQFNCEKILEQASTFCLKTDCSIYNSSDDLQAIE